MAKSVDPDLVGADEGHHCLHRPAFLNILKVYNAHRLKIGKWLNYIFSIKSGVM